MLRALVEGAAAHRVASSPLCQWQADLTNKSEENGEKEREPRAHGFKGRGESTHEERNCGFRGAVRGAAGAGRSRAEHASGRAAYRR